MNDAQYHEDLLTTYIDPPFFFNYVLRISSNLYYASLTHTCILCYFILYYFIFLFLLKQISDFLLRYICFFLSLIRKTKIQYKIQ